MMLYDTRCGLDASSLHRTTSMVNYISKKFKLLSCHRDTYNSLMQVNKSLMQVDSKLTCINKNKLKL